MSQRFRPDIQGLRALAVLLVALDHARIGPFHGGYVGVDVFFVISGFLITGLLLREATRSGSVSLLDFYARRARRIVPAAAVVLIVTVVASVYLLSGVEALATVKDAVWTTFFAANFKFASDGTDYFNGDAPPSPLQHYWSLAVEEQFYLVWPLLLLVICLLVRRWWKRRSVVDTTAMVITAIIVGSLALSVVQTQADPVATYFSPFARAWELGLGALAACLADRVVRRTTLRTRQAAGWIGLLAVLAAALTYDASTEFPGYAAALPVVGTVLLLLSGLRRPDEQDSWVGPQPLLTLPPMRILGDWSYSFYLWHWPLLILAARGWHPLSTWSAAGVLLLGVALSGITYTFVENPARHWRPLASSAVRGVLVYPASVVVVLALLSGAHAAIEREANGGGPAITVTNYGQQPGDPKPDFSKSPAVALVQASVLAAENGMEIPGHLSPSPLDTDERKPDLGDCDYYPQFVDRICPRGDESGDRTLVLIGDSHARQWIPALDELTKQAGYRAFYLVREGCPGADVTTWLKVGGANESCDSFQDWAVQQVAELQPDVTIVASEANSNRGYVDDSGELITDADQTAEMFRDGVEREVDRLAPNSGRVVYLGDPPATTFQGVICLSRRNASLESCMAHRDPRVLQMIDAAREGALAAGAQYVDPTPWLCVGDDCPAVVGHYVPRRDLAHITVEYAEHLAPALGHELRLDGPDDAAQAGGSGPLE